MTTLIQASPLAGLRSAYIPHMHFGHIFDLLIKHDHDLSPSSKNISPRIRNSTPPINKLNQSDLTLSNAGRAALEASFNESIPLATDDLKDAIRPHHEIIRHCIHDLFDSPEPLEITHAEANDLRFLFLTLAEEVLHDPKLVKELNTEGRFHNEKELSDALIELSKYFSDVNKKVLSH